ncbi:FAFR580Cp [Eremothecium gossypii FDAG1]|nr:FAFR580Cp [Eremothecium gossypii FDAG1]
MVASQRKYICSFCAQAFSRSEHKTRHERSHTGVKPFSCKVCNHSFVRRDLLQRHIRTVHRSMLLEIQLRHEGTDHASACEARQIEQALNSFITVQSPRMRSGARCAAGRPRAGIPGGCRASVEPRGQDKFPAEAGRKSQAPQSAGTGTEEPYAISGPLSASIPQELHELVFRGFRKLWVDAPAEGFSKVAGWLQEGLEHIERTRLFAAEVRRELQKALRKRAAFAEWCEQSPLVAAIVLVGHVSSADRRQYGDGMVGMVKGAWERCVGPPLDSVFVAQSLLVYVCTQDRKFFPHSPVETARMYERMLHGVVLKSELALWDDELWTAFQLFVELVLVANEYTEVSLQLYQWFLGQPLHDGYSLSYYLNALAQNREIVYTAHVMATISQSLFCEIVMSGHSQTNFQYPDMLHNTIIMANKCYAKQGVATEPSVGLLWERIPTLKTAPQKFFNMLSQYFVFSNSSDHWSLLLATWFDFVKRVCETTVSSNLQNRNFCIDSRWFYRVIQGSSPMAISSTMARLNIDLSFMNNNLAICTLPIISLLEAEKLSLPPNMHHIHKQMVFDVLLFNLHLFGNILFVPSEAEQHVNVENALKMLENPIVQFLLYVWFHVLNVEEPKHMMVGKTNTTDSGLDMAYAEQFLNRYITISKVNVDTDTLIKNDINVILFAKGTDTAAFYGLHILLVHILGRIEGYLKRLFPFYIAMAQSFRELVAATLECVANMKYSIRTKIYRTVEECSLSSKASLHFSTSLLSPKLGTDDSSPAPARRHSSISSNLMTDKIILPPINFQAVTSAERSYVYYQSGSFLPEIGAKPSARDSSGKCKIQLPPPSRLFNVPSTQ